MAAIPYHVARAFLEGKKAKAGNFVSTGTQLWSYRMRLAHKDESGKPVLDFERGDSPSRTTSRHMKATLLPGFYTVVGEQADADGA